MSKTLLPQGARPAPRTRRPRPTIRRCIREVETLADGKIVSNLKSLTKNDGTQYEAIIDPHTGEGRCTCPHFIYRGARCKHILRALENAARKHQLDEVVAGLVARGMTVFPASELESENLNQPSAAADAEYEAYWNGLSDAQIEAMAPPLYESAREYQRREEAEYRSRSYAPVPLCEGCDELEPNCKCEAWAFDPLLVQADEMGALEIQAAFCGFAHNLPLRRSILEDA